MRISALLLVAVLASAQSNDENRDESKVPKYTLPDPLVLQNGQRVKSAREWTAKRRPEVLELFRREMYGRSPARPARATHELTAVDKQAFGGKAVRKEVRVYFSEKKDGPKMDILIYLPPAGSKPVPIFLGLNFNGNQAVSADPGVRLGALWARVPGTRKLQKRPAADEDRGTEAGRWQVEKILAHGYGLATIYYCDIEPDFDGALEFGVRSMYPAPGADGWAAIAAWAWGLSRAMDYLETDRQVDAKHVALMGHSRLGKTALWAGAEDTRFAMVIANNSGEGGGSLSRREFGEQPRHLNKSFPHWFNGNYKKYSDREGELPFDQHELIALMAPRPVYLATAAEDLHADPKGEFLAEVAAGPVYRLLGKQDLGTEQWPAAHQPIHRDLGYHHRTGKHDVTEYDWEQYLAFADLHWKK